MTTFLAKDFNNRQELERKVSSLFGLTADSKPDNIITGTKEELKKLSLSHGKVFWGIRCEASDFEKNEKRIEPQRGKIHETKVENVDINNSKE